MDGHRRAVGDVLPRHVLDVPFERVGVGNARVAGRVQLQRQGPRPGQARFRALDVPGLRLLPVGPAYEEPPALGELVRDGGRRAVARRLRVPPGHRPRAHRCAEQVARGDGTGQRIPRDCRVPRKGDVHPEVGTPIRGHQERGVDAFLPANVVVLAGVGGVSTSAALLRRLGPRPIGLEDRPDRVGPERAVLRQREGPLGAAPRRDLDRPFVHATVLRVANAHDHRRPGLQEADAARCVLAQDGLEVDVFTEAIHAAIGEDAAAQEWRGLVEIHARAELPRADPLVPVAARVGDVAVLFRRGDEGKAPPIVRVAQRRVGRHRDSVRSGGAAPVDAVVQPHERDVRAGDGRAIVEASDEEQGVLRAVLDRDAEVGHLDDRGARSLDVRVAGAARARDGLPFLDGRPHETRAVRLQHARHVQAVRLDPVGRHRQPARRACPSRRLVEVVLLQPHERRHQVGQLKRGDPLRDVAEVVRVERQHPAAVFFPDAMPVSEARERALVPVVHDPQPRIPERLPVSRPEIGARGDRVLPHRRLRPKAGIFQRQSAARVGRLLAAWPRCRRLDHGSVRRRRDVGRRDRGGKRLDAHLPPHLDRVPPVRLALHATVELVDEEGPFRLDRERLLLTGGRGARRGRHARVDGQTHPALRLHGSGGLQHHHVATGRIRLAIPVGRETQLDGGGGSRDRACRAGLGIEAVDGLWVGHAKPRLLFIGERRRRPVVALQRGLHMGGDVGGAHGLVEPKKDDDVVGDVAASPIPFRLEQLDRRCREPERHGARQLAAADGRRGGIDRHVVAGRIRERPLRVRREHQNGRTGPAEGAGHRRRDLEERRPHDGRDPAERHHWLREHDPDLARLGERRDLAGRTGADHGQRRWGPRALRGVDRRYE